MAKISQSVDTQSMITKITAKIEYPPQLYSQIFIFIEIIISVFESIHVKTLDIPG
jgi:hypothetical protein